MIDIEPTFTTARGHVSEWIDHARQWETMWRYHEAFISMCGPGGSFINGPRQFPEAEIRAWAGMRRTVNVVVAIPNLARLVDGWNGTNPHVPDALQIFNPREHLQCRLDGDRITAAFAQPISSSNRDDLGAFCYGNYDEEALALLKPKCFLHGWEPTADARIIDHFGSPAWEVRMERLLPFSDPRMCGDHDNPNIFENAEAAEFVIDRKQGVVLEWRALLDGEPHERHWFTELAFDEPLDYALFDRSDIPVDVTVER